MKPKLKSFFRGDTLIEVMFAVAVFGLAAVGAIALMNTGLASVQNSLETTMARQEIDAQAEALRFIHDAYLTEPDTKDADSNSTNNFRNLWKTIVASAYPASNIDTSGKYSGGVVSEDPAFFTRTVSNKSNCDSLFTTQASNGTFGIPKQSFVINTRGLNLLTAKITDASGNAVTKVLTDTDIRQNIFISSGDSVSGATFTTASTYPRLLYGVNNVDGESLSDAFIDNNALKYKNATSRLDRAEGVWVTAVTSKSGLQCYDENGNPEGGVRPDFYDFYIQTCWDSVSGNASVISSTVRLFNPDQVNLKKQGMITFDDDAWVDFDRFLDTCNSANSYDCQEILASECTPDKIYNCKTLADGKTYKHRPYYQDEEFRHSIFERNADDTGTIHFNGYHSSPMDEGRYADLSGESVVDIKLNAKSSGYTGHTNGTFHLSIGRVGDDHITSASINEKGGEVKVGDTTRGMGQNFGLWLHYDHGTYTIYAANDTDYSNLGSGNVIGTYTDTGDNGDIRITLWYTHSSHGCSSRDSAIIENILITRPMVEDTGGGCVKVTPTPTENPESIVSTDDDNTSGPGEQPKSEEPEDPTEQVEETIVVGEGNALQYFDMKFNTTLSNRIGVKASNSIMIFPSVNRIDSDAKADAGTCSEATSYGGVLANLLLHCMYPYSHLEDNRGSWAGYSGGTFVIYLDRDSLTNDSNTTYAGTGTTIDNFWDKNIKATIYFYDRILYFDDTLGHEDQFARYIISSDTARTIDSNGRYWIIARISGNPGTRNYWADKLEIINQRTNTNPSAYL